MDQCLAFFEMVEGGEDLRQGCIVGVGASDERRFGHGALFAFEDCDWFLVGFLFSGVDGEAVGSWPSGGMDFIAYCVRQSRG